MIASSAFFVLDGILNWPVVNYDGSWSQWGQLSGSAANGGQLRTDSPWRTDTAARSELIVYNYDTTAGPVFFTGTGLNDMAAGGTFTGTVNRNYRIEIDDATVTPNTFRWSQDGGTTWSASGVGITAGVAQAVGADGMTVTFTGDAGHTLVDRWDFITRRGVELLSLDGGSCSGRRLVDGINNEYVPTGCILVPPSSYALSANQIEEEDADYMQGGGGGGGSAPITPGY